MSLFSQAQLFGQRLPGHRDGCAQLLVATASRVGSDRLGRSGLSGIVVGVAGPKACISRIDRAEAVRCITGFHAPVRLAF